MAAQPDMHKKILGKGGGEVLVWLHGWGQDHRSFLPLADLFKKDHTNILYDLPGFGKSPRLKKGAGTGAYARALLADLEKRKEKKVILVGHSFGCRVALRAAKENPRKITGLVLIASAGLPRKRNVFWRLKSSSLKIIGKACSGMDKIFKTRLKAKYSRRFGSRDYRDAGELRETFVATVTENLTDVARDLPIPALLIYGAEDKETPPEIGIKFERLLPQGKIIVLEGLDHYNILTRGKHQCQHLMKRFIGGLGKHGQ